MTSNISDSIIFSFNFISSTVYSEFICYKTSQWNKKITVVKSEPSQFFVEKNFETKKQIFSAWMTTMMMMNDDDDDDADKLY